MAWDELLWGDNSELSPAFTPHQLWLLRVESHVRSKVTLLLLLPACMYDESYEFYCITKGRNRTKCSHLADWIESNRSCSSFSVPQPFKSLTRCRSVVVGGEEECALRAGVNANKCISNVNSSPALSSSNYTHAPFQQNYYKAFGTRFNWKYSILSFDLETFRKSQL